MTRFEILTETHKVHVADYNKELKYVFNKAHTDGNQSPSVQSLSKIVHSTEKLAVQAPRYDNVGIQDVPKEVLDFLDENGFNVEKARNRYRF